MKIKTTGIKARDRQIELAKLTILTGPNGIGKSTIPIGIRWGFLGFEPPLGKQPARTARLMANGEMAVEITLDEKRVFNRRMRRLSKGVTSSAECSWLQQGNPEEHDAEILSLVGREAQDAIDGMYVKALQDATGPDRSRRIDSMLAAFRKTPAELKDIVAKLTIQRVGNIEAERMTAPFLEYMVNLKPAEQKALISLADMLEAKLVETGSTGALAWANGAKNDAKLKLDGKEKAKKELEARLTALPEAIDGEVARLEEERGKLERELGAAAERAEAVKKKADAIAAANRSKDDAERTLAEKERELNALQEAAAAVDQKREQLKQVVADLENISQTPPKREANPEPDQLRLQAQAKLDELSDLVEKPAPGLYAPTATVRDLEDRLKGAKASPWTEVRTIAKRLVLIEAAKADADRLLEISKNSLKDDAADLQTQLEAAKKKRDEVLAEIEKVNAENTRIRDRRAALKKEADDLHARAKDSQERHDGAQNKRYADWQQEVRTLTGRKHGLTDDIARHDRQLEAATDGVGSATILRDETAKRHTDLWQGGSADDAAAQGPNHEARLAEIKTTLEDLRRGAAARAELTTMIEAIDTLTAEHTVLAGIEWALKRVREEELNAAGGPLLEHMEKFLRAAGRTETPFIEAKRDLCEIGWRDTKARTITIEVLSDGEWQLYAAALASAVLALRKPPLRILIVEAGEIMRRNVVGLLRGIEAVQDTFDYALVMTPHELPEELDGWKVITIEEEAHVG